LSTEQVAGASSSTEKVAGRIFSKKKKKQRKITKNNVFGCPGMAAPEPACRSSGGSKFYNRFYYQNDCILNQKDALVRGGLETPKKVANK